MKIIRLLIMATAFLIMVSSALTLNNALALSSTTDITPVYINLAAMVGLVAVITMLNLQKNKQNNK